MIFVVLLFVCCCLISKDALRTAELEKMQRQEEAKRHKEAINVSAFEETPTSVLCIRCKRSLDDLSNIRMAVYGYGNTANPKKKQCEAFRSLLPNLKGKRLFVTSSYTSTSLPSNSVLSHHFCVPYLIISVHPPPSPSSNRSTTGAYFRMATYLHAFHSSLQNA